MPLPAWLARTVHMPVATAVAIVPLTLHVLVVRLTKVIGNPDDVLAISAKGVVETACAPGFAKLILWFIRVTVKLRSMLGAAR